MAKLSIQAGSTGVTLSVFVQASTATDGSGLTGLLGTSANLTAAYYRPGDKTTAVPITLGTSSLAAGWTSGLFVEIDSTRMPGFYRFDPPNAALGTGSPSCAVVLKGATSMAPCPLEIELTAWNNQDSTAGGINNLSATGTLGSVSNVRGTATVILFGGTHANAVIPIVQTASVALTANTVGTASGVPAVVLAAGTHSGAIIPIVQTASVALTANTVGTASGVPAVVLAAGTHSGAVIPVVQTASVVLTANTVGTASGVPAVILASGTHVGAVIPVVQTASVALTANTVGTASGIPPVILSTGTHTGAIIPTVNVVSTSNDGRMANLDAAVSSRGTGMASPGDAMALTGGERATLATVIGTASQAEAYRGTGVGGSVAQLMYEIAGHLGNANIVGTTKSVMKADLVTTAQTFNLDNSTAPTSVARKT